MNKLHLTIVFILISLASFAQKKGMNYQAVIIDPKAIDIPGVAITGQPLVNSEVCIKFGILNGSTIEFEEVQKTKTDDFGLVNLTIGSGTKTSLATKYSTFESIIWDANVKSLQVSVSFDNCATFQQVSIQAFNYTPYAFYAGSVDYKNVRDAPRDLSYFGNDVGYLVDKDLDPLRKNIGQNTTDIANLKQETTDKFSVINQSIVDLEKRVTNNQIDIAAIKIKNTAQDDSLALINNKLAIHDSKISTLEKSSTTLNTKIDSVNTNLTSKIAGNTSQITTINQTLVNQQNQITQNNTTLNNKTDNLQYQIWGLGNTYEVLSNKSTATDLGNANPSNTLYPSQKAVKTYVDVTIQDAIATGAPDATTLAKGKVQLAGDLAGTADLPRVPALANKEELANKTTDITGNAGSQTKYPTVKAIKDYVDASVTGLAFQANLDLKANIDSPTFTGTPVLPSATQAATQPLNNNSNAIATTQFVQSALAAGVVDANAFTKGKIRLAGDLAGDAQNPTVPGLLLKEDLANKSNDADLGTSTSKYPTQAAVKTYVDNQFANAAIPDATTTTKGKIQLGGDLNGVGTTAAAPVISDNAITTNKINDGAVTNPKIANGAVTNAKIGETISVANGGTGATTATGALTNLGAEPTANKSNDVNLGTSSTLFPTQNAVKNYVDTQFANAAIPDATTTSKGKIQLGGDLNGAGTTAAAPVISDAAITTNKLLNAAVTTTKIANLAVTDAKINSVSGSKVTGNIPGNAQNVNGVVDVANGGTGNAATLTGYIKGNGASPMTSSPTIPVADIVDGQSISNLSTATDLGNTSSSDVLYPSQLAVKTYVDAHTNSAVGTSTQTALNLKEDVANKDSNVNLGTSNTAYPTQNAVKAYVDTKFGGTNAINSLTGLPNIADQKVLGNMSGGITTPQELPTTGTGNVVFGTSPDISTPTLTSPVLNGTISGSAVMPIANGGTGATTLSIGYVKGGASSLSTVSNIPWQDVTGAVHTVNGNTPDPTTGNVAIAFGMVTTGLLANRPAVAGTNNGDIYVVSGETGATASDNGRTFISTGGASGTWNEVTPNQASLDARYVQLAGSTMAGNLIFPTGTKATMADAPVNNTDLVNKDYVDARVSAATPDATALATGKIQLAGDLTGSATNPLVNNKAITFPKMQDVSTNVVLGRSSTGSGSIEALTTLPVATLPALTGDVTTVSGTAATTITDHAVTYNKIQNLSAQSLLLGTGSNGGTSLTEISLGTGLTMNNGVLNSTIGTVTNVSGTPNRVSVTNGTTTPTVDIASNYVGQSSITTLGTVTAGTWSASTIGVAYGGTGVSTLAAGYVKADGTNPLTTTATIPVADVVDAETINNKSTATDLGGSTPTDIKYPTQLAVKTYVDATVSGATPEATTSVLGKVKLGGDLAGSGTTASAPIITSGAINTDKLADNSVTTAKIIDGSVETADVADLGITTAKIAVSAVTSAKIADGTIVVGDIADDAIESIKIKNDAVTTDKIADLNVTNAKLEADAITTDKIKDGEVQTADIKDANVTTAKIADLAVSTTKIEHGTANQVLKTNAAGTATEWGKLTADNIIAKDLTAADASITVSNGVGATLINSDLKVSDAGITTAKIADNAVITAKIADGNVTEVKLAPDAVTSAKILDGTIATADLGNNSVSTDKIIDANVTDVKLATSSVTTTKIAADAVTTAKILDGTIVNADIADATITSAKIAGTIAIANGGTGATTATGALTNLGAEAVANKSAATDMGGINADDVKYPTQLAVKTFVETALNAGVGTAMTNALNLKEDLANKSIATDLGAGTSSNTLYPSQLAVKTYVDTKLTATNAIVNLTSLPNISNNTILGNTTGAIGTPHEIPVTGTGDVVLKTSATINTPTITSPVLNGTISGTAIVPVNQGGSGVNMSTTAGYVKQASTGANFTTVTSIPVSDVTGAVRMVNGATPNANGEVTVPFGTVYTGLLASRSSIVPTPSNGDIYVLSGESNTNDNGLTYIYDGTLWQEVTSNLSATDARYVKLSGSTMTGSLLFPTNTKITLTDAPASATDAANKAYVDAQITAATPDATTSATGKIQLAGDLTGTAVSPEIAANKVTFAKMQTVSSDVILGRSSTGTGNIEALTTLPVATLPALTGDVTTSAGSAATTIANNAVTLAKIQNLSAQSKLLGTPSTGGLGVAEISLGTGLTMTNGTLNAMGGTVTAVSGTTDRVTVTNGATTPSVDIASTYVGQSSITTLGTITTGTWNGTTISVPNGGTGATTLTGYVIGNGTNAMTASATIPVEHVTGAQTTANLSANITTNTGSTSMYPSVAAVETALALKAPLVSPTFTGVPSGPTAAAGISTTQLATTAFVTTAVAAATIADADATTKGKIQLAGDLGGTAGSPTVPGLALKAPLASPTFTGVPSGPTAAAGANTTQLATTAFVTTAVAAATIADADATTKGKIQLAGDLGGTAGSPTVPGLALKAPLASPTFTGVPSGPTAAAGTNTTQLATTAFVTAASGTPFYKASTTNDILSDKTSNFYTNKSVGIGTNSPQSNLDVVGSFGLRSAAGANGTGYGMEFNTNSSAPRIDWVANGAYIGQFASDTEDFLIKNSKSNLGDIRFWTNTGGSGFERVTILNNGNLGIGTISPTERLEISGNVLATSFKKSGGTAAQFLKADGSVDAIAYAPLASPALTGTPTAPTATAGDNTTNIATTAFVTTAVAAATIADATASVKGKIQLAGDLGGTAAAPLVAKLQGTAVSSTAPTTNQLLQYDGTSWVPVAKSSVAKLETDEFTPTAGQTAFTLTNTPLGRVAMFVNGVRVPKAAVSVSGLTATYVPASNGAYTLLTTDRVSFDYIY